VNRARQAWPAARGGLLHFNEKKPGPRGPGLKFASVGALANHLPEGKNCAPAIAKSGRITANRMLRSGRALCKGPPRCTTWKRACQPCATDRSSGQVT